MPESINDYQPTKRYFRRSEAMQILDCTRSWLEARWRLIGFVKGGRTHRRYSSDELNILIEERKKSNGGFDRGAYMREYMRKYREMGKGIYVRKSER